MYTVILTVTNELMTPRYDLATRSCESWFSGYFTESKAEYCAADAIVQGTVDYRFMPSSKMNH